MSSSYFKDLFSFVLPMLLFVLGIIIIAYFTTWAADTCPAGKDIVNRLDFPIACEVKN